MQYVKSITYGALIGSPASTPNAIPVSAAWPIASEKNAILLVTTIVPIPPKIVPINKVHISEFITNAYLKYSGNICLFAISVKKVLIISSIFTISSIF